MVKILGLIIFFSRRLYIKSTRWSHSYKWKRKIRRLIKSRDLGPIASEKIREIREYYSSFNIHGIDTSWHRFYTESNGRFDIGYFPENLFYLNFEPQLNREGFSNVLSDKNLLDRLFVNVKQPIAVVKNVNGFFLQNNEKISTQEALELCKRFDELVIKPSIDTGGGKNVIIYKRSEDDSNGLKTLLLQYGKDFIVQKKVEQHEMMSLLNESSLNTFRVMTFLKEDTVVILSTIVRMGQKGARTDNSTSGGISCGVKDDGTLREVGFKLNGESFHTTSMGHEFSEIKFQFISKIHDTAKKLHEKIPYFRIISWDLTYDKNNNVVLIEYNIKGQDINFHQLNNGPVLRPLLHEVK